MSWYLYTLLAGVFLSASVILDKHIVDKRLGHVSATTITALAGLAGIPFLAGILFLFPTVPSPRIMLLGTATGWLLIAAYQLYYTALRRADASLVTTLFQFILPFNYLFGVIVFREHIHTINIAGLILIALAATIIASEERQKKWRLRGDVLGIMLVASALISCSDALFKAAAAETSFKEVIIVEYASSILAGLVLLSFKKVRQELRSLKKIAGNVTLMSQTNELLNLGGMLALRYALTIGPIALIQGALAAQPIIVFTMALLLGFVFPHMQQHTRRSRWRYTFEAASMCAVIAGSVLITR